MPQSLSHVLIHVVFSTKERTPLIDRPVRRGLHAYLATVSRNEGCHAYRVGGVSDHVHILSVLSRTLSIARFVERIKKTSSAWMKGKGAKYTKFYWQNGYGAFSISPSHLNAVMEYIDTQEEHHKRVSFQDEYRKFLKKYGIPYDERYVWD
jgi:REP element-mobilizing transposase RayT